MTESIRSFVVAITDVEGMVFDALLTFDNMDLVSVHRVEFSSHEPMQVRERHEVEDVEEILHFEDFESEKLHGEFLGQFLSVGDTCSVEEEVL